LTLFPRFVLDILCFDGMGVPVNTHIPRSQSPTDLDEERRASPSPTEAAKATFENQPDLFGLIYLDLPGGVTTAKADFAVPQLSAKISESRNIQIPPRFLCLLPFRQAQGPEFAEGLKALSPSMGASSRLFHIRSRLL
jgi:hypothetical protein